MNSKYPVRGPWFGGLEVQATNTHIPNEYDKALNALYKNLQNGSGKPPSDARMDFCACNLALIESTKKIKV